MRALLKINAPTLVRGMSVTISNGQEITIGSSRWAELKLDDSGLSGVHLQFSLISDECWLRDLKSAGGTYVNGTKILATEICDGDVVNAGEASIIVSFLGDRKKSDAAKFVGTDSHEGWTGSSGLKNSAGLSTIA